MTNASLRFTFARVRALAAGLVALMLFAALLDATQPRTEAGAASVRAPTASAVIVAG